MVQEFRVLRCYSCQVFQVQQVKKSKKWECKLCGEKQSLLKVYGQGSGADCRHHVQKLNLLQGQAEQAATSADRESCENVTYDDDVGDVEQGLTDSQEAAPVSRWNKYVEENCDDTCEEEEEPISDEEHYYSHQECTQRTVRKRNHFQFCQNDLDTEVLKENISKKKKMYEGGNPSETSRFSSKIREDMESLEQPDRPTSHAFPLQTGSDTFLPVNSLMGDCKPSTCTTGNFQNWEPRMDAVFNHFDHTKKIRPDYSVTSSQDILPNDECSPMNRLSAQTASPRLHEAGLENADQPSHIIPKSRSSVSLQKEFIQSNLFQTDEDFDDNY